MRTLLSILMLVILTGCATAARNQVTIELPPVEYAK